MDIYKVVNPIFSFYYSPLNFNVNNMQVNILLMCKLLFVLLCFHGFINDISDPHIPFVLWLDKFNNYPNIFETIFKSLIIGSGTLLIFNYRVRMMCLILGVSVITVLISSKALFRNHLLICGCFFLLSGLLKKEDKPWLLYFQLSLIYFGAVINKVFQIDWWNGQFMYNWLYNARGNQVFIGLSNYIPGIVIAKAFSWASMLIETSIALSILRKQLHTITVWLILIFHTLLYTLTVFRFGHFYEDILIILLIFLNWPKGSIELNSQLKIFTKLKKLGLFSNYIINKSNNHNSFLSIKIEDCIFYKWHALRKLLLYNTNFYLLLFFIDFLIRFLFNGQLMDTIHIIITWFILLFFLLLMWYKKLDKPV
jgi:hypothetical protein